VTQDRLAERRFAESVGAEVAPWREVRSTDDLHAAATDLGLPLRLKVVTGGYDGRGQIRLAADDDMATAFDRLGRVPGDALLAEAELAFEAELSVIVARGFDGRMATFPISRNAHDQGILSESVAPAPVASEVAECARTLGERLALAMGLVGTLTAELFLMPDGRLIVNELAPRVHNSGHWTIEGATTSQFQQHVRAICGLPLGSVEPRGSAAMVNLLGTGSKRPARLTGLPDALVDPSVGVHVYGKRAVFERRKMGHVTALAPDGETEQALNRARTAAARLGWAD
jgi:5-(carboxyamino)imidazole ribonucleotide synthase